MFQGKLYPNSRDGSRKDTRTKKDFLNPYQREELKKRLIEKYTKLYALNNPGMVKMEVDNFFQQNNEINSQNLLVLEQRIKSQSLKGRSNAVPPNKTTTSSRLETTGAQGAKAIYDYNSNDPQHGGYHQSQHLAGQTANLVTNCEHMSMGPMGQSDLDAQKLSEMQQVTYANEEEEWGTVYKYNHYLYKQEEKMKKIREEQKRIANQQQLDIQMQEKARREAIEKAKEESYVNAQKQMADIERQKEEARKKYLEEKAKIEKETRDMQRRDIKERRDFETQQDKALDAYLIQKIKEEVLKEEQQQAEAKLRKKNEMRRVMDENEERKKILAAQAEKERLEEVELQKKAIALAQELEEARAAEIKAKADRISSILKNSEDKVNDIKKKNLEMDMKNQRYQELREKAMRQKEAKELQLAEQRKTQLKTFLDKQVENKKKKEDEEKHRNDEQAVVWKSEQDQFQQFMNERNQKKKDTMDLYRKELKGQMNLRQEKEREMASMKMTANEAAMNKLLLNKIRNLKIDEEYIKDLKRPMQYGVNNIY